MCSNLMGHKFVSHHSLDVGLVLPAAAPVLGHWVAPLGHRPWPWTQGGFYRPSHQTSDVG